MQTQEYVNWINVSYNYPLTFPKQLTSLEVQLVVMKLAWYLVLIKIEVLNLLPVKSMHSSSSLLNTFLFLTVHHSWLLWHSPFFIIKVLFAICAHRFKRIIITWKMGVIKSLLQITHSSFWWNQELMYIQYKRMYHFLRIRIFQCKQSLFIFLNGWHGTPVYPVEQSVFFPPTIRYNRAASHEIHTEPLDNLRCSFKNMLPGQNQGCSMSKTLWFCRLGGLSLV